VYVKEILKPMCWDHIIAVDVVGSGVRRGSPGHACMLPRCTVLLGSAPLFHLVLEGSI
jgi:hypothetical protein